MSSTFRHGISSILVVVTETTHIKPLISHASTVARQYKASLTFIDVNDYLDKYIESLSTIMPREELKSIVLGHRAVQLHEHLQADGSAECLKAQVKVIDGIPFVEAVREVLNQGHDLVIKGRDVENQYQRRGFGSTDMHLIRKCPVPVWLVDAGTFGPLTEVIAAVDLVSLKPEVTSLNRQVLAMANRVCEVFDSNLTLLGAWDLAGGPNMRERFLTEVGEEHESRLLEQLRDQVYQHQGELIDAFSLSYPDAEPLTCHCIKGDACDVIPRYLSEHSVGLVVMGSVSRVGIPGLLIGTTAEAVLNSINCPVLTLKPEGFVSPVSFDT